MVWPLAVCFGPTSPLCQNTHIAIEAKLCAKMEQHNKQNWDNQKAEIKGSSFFFIGKFTLQALSSPNFVS